MTDDNADRMITNAQKMKTMTGQGTGEKADRTVATMAELKGKSERMDIAYGLLREYREKAELDPESKDRAGEITKELQNQYNLTKAEIEEGVLKAKTIKEQVEKELLGAKPADMDIPISRDE